MRRSSTSSFLMVLMFVLSLAAPTASPAQKKSEKATPAAVAKPNLGDFDDYVNQALKDWKVPGVAVAVVQGDNVILLKGYGYRDLEKQLPVTPNTLFAIGSITKSFTVSTLGMEMDEGKVDWDKSLTTYDIDKTNFYDFGLPDDNQVSPPAYSNQNDAPPAYPFGNSVKLGNGVSCNRDGVTVSCKLLHFRLGAYIFSESFI